MNRRPPTPSVDTPAREDSTRAKTESSSRLLLVIGVIVLALACVGAIAYFASTRGDGVPRLNSDTPALVKFINTDKYLKLPFDRQALYMKVIEDRSDNDELDKAFLTQKISEAEFRNALQEAWLGEQLKRAEKYANLPVGSPRAEFIADLIQRKEEKKALALRNPNKVKPTTEADEIKRDATLEQIRINQWPEPVRLQWANFSKAYRDQKEAREKMARAATSQPTASNP